MNLNIDKKLLTQLTYFAVMVIVGLLIWLLVTNVLMPPQATINRDLTALTRVTVNPDLETDSLKLMEEGRVFAPGELEAFTIYLDDSEENKNTPDLVIRRMAPIEPLDLGYYILNDATMPAQVDVS